ncbi:MAG: HEAT repeat domain-containing protein, partial [Gemmataceae bacterium]|nr:HEAT repeat domain-containing protein [Gemmataceae bacterium]
MPMKYFAAFFALAILSTFPSSLAAGQSAAPLELRPGDRIGIIGNTLADRMQLDGWLETFLYARFPKHDLVFRNLGFSGDELKVRLRSADFGSPDHWLKFTNTDVVFAFFGYNESFAGQQGLAKFESDLDGFLKQTQKQQYNGQSSPRIVLFSPIAHEDLKNPNLPDGSDNNKRLALYTAAMAKVAKANNVTFVDLFDLSQKLYAQNERPLTINGIHLNELGNELLAEGIDKALFPKEPRPRDTELLDKIRRAVVDKNFHWFNRYRTVDGYSIYGGRADLKFVAGQTNRVVMQREMEILDAMTANRDRRIWAIAASGGRKPPDHSAATDDSNTPDFIPVVTNKPGPLVGGKHIYLGGNEAIGLMTVAKNMKVNLFASEKEFPDLVNPVQMSFDPKGRLWVAVWPTYPHWKPKEPMNDKLLIFEDTNGDGRADKMSVFADDLHCPTGFEFYNGGVLVAQAPDIVFLKDTNGDGKADQRVRVLSGLDSADTHHTANSFVLDPGGALYFQEGTFHHTQVETPWGPPARCANAGVFRYEPRNHKFDVYVNYGFANPHGHVFDRWGQDFVVDGTGANPWHAALFSGQTEYPQRHARPPQLYQQKTRPCPGMEILSSRHFPEENQGNLLVGNVIGFHGILQYKIKDKGSSFEGVEVEPIVSSKDPNFRPSDLRIGPDGAIYFLDWHNPIIGHMQHNLRDPSRGREHGRIYRVTYEGRKLSSPIKIAGEPIERLLDLLKEPEDRVRYRTRMELGGRDTGQVIAAMQKWLGKLDAKDPEHEHHLLEGLWLHQSHNVVNEELLKQMLRSPDFRARAAATRVLCYWRDRISNPLDLLREKVNDPHPRVRLEAIRALSFFPVSRGTDLKSVQGEGETAVAIALEMFAHPDDEYLRFTFNETLNTLERRVGSGAKVDRKNIAATLLGMLSAERVPPERQPVLLETICRHGGPKELQVVWDKSKDLKPALRRQVYAWLAEAATTRRTQPKVQLAALREVLANASKDPALLAETVRLAAAWKVKETATELRALASDANAPVDARSAALDGLAAFNDADSQKTLRGLALSAQPLALRFHAAAALARVDLEAGSTAAAQALAVATEADDPAPMVEAFLIRKNGPEKLAAALDKEKIS